MEKIREEGKERGKRRNKGRLCCCLLPPLEMEK